MVMVMVREMCTKHCKNCECCPVSLLLSGQYGCNVLVRVPLAYLQLATLSFLVFVIVVLHCQFCVGWLCCVVVLVSSYIVFFFKVLFFIVVYFVDAFFVDAFFVDAFFVVIFFIVIFFAVVFLVVTLSVVVFIIKVFFVIGFFVVMSVVE